jgi:prepilin-type N-terminal cleavage/methylation domain-containing protein
MKRNIDKNKGFTLIELMIVVVIIGVLAILAVPRFFEATRKAKYSQAKVFMNVIYKSMYDFYNEKGCYPADVYPNVPPPGFCPQYYVEWPGPSRDPFFSLYDYECWSKSGGDYWIGVVYLGRNLVHDGGTDGGSYYATHGNSGAILEYGDDVYLVIDVAGAPCP